MSASDDVAAKLIPVETARQSASGALILTRRLIKEPDGLYRAHLLASSSHSEQPRG